jgi:hypothetical protein
MTIRGPVFILNDGVEMPAIGLGVFQTPPDATTAAVEEARCTGGNGGAKVDHGSGVVVALRAA